jgi:1,4-dihydroxy-2-naphthoyl-CoA hydrolase
VQPSPALDPDAPDLLDQLNGFLGELNERLGIRFTSAARDSVTATMPVVGNRQPFGLLHGGANAALAETLGSVHATLLAPARTLAVGIELSCAHHLSAGDGTVTGRSRVLSAGRSLCTTEIVVTNERDRRLCTARLTCFFRPL